MEDGDDLEKGERPAHREGKRRLAGRAGLEKFFCFATEDVVEDFWFAFCFMCPKCSHLDPDHLVGSPSTRGSCECLVSAAVFL